MDLDCRLELPSEGTRLSLYGNLGTIKFIGNIDSTSGIWLGVEWDDPQRGKHDGVKDGKRYFTCRIPGSGSFIRPSASIIYGHSFLRALMSKYVELPHGTTTTEKVLLGSSNGAIEVEAVGLDKIRGKFANLQNLREISLDGGNVAACDPPGEIRKICPNLRGVDLSRSLLPSWDVVALIAAELPYLERLALNGNRLQPSQDFHHATSAFRTLTDLQLNTTLMTWREMQEFTMFMPNLRLIELGYNHLVTLSPGSPLMTPSESTVQTINLDSNECHEWDQICQALGPYKSLQRLILTSNRINKIPSLSDQRLRLQSLKHLSLSFNHLTSWSDLDALSHWCPGLEILSLAGNPITEGHHSRQFTVARIPSLLILDAVAISEKERTDCELYYLSHIVHNGPFAEDERCQKHPRWKELCSRHGTPEEIAAIKFLPDKLSNRIIQINIYQTSSAFLSKASEKGAFLLPPRQLRVLQTMPLRTLRLKIIKSVRSSPQPRKGSVELWLRTRDEELVQMDTRHDDRDLSWWGIENDSHILYYINDT